ncbi:hypothetical protein PHYSODRAFT_322207 [Phytophthora sojae]|uniref:Uncharacterized protein n=1 Tax=Phytophthora sojae (strain P6497) TaxID=1094619 RepID=G4YKG4_PHYSP|nr:hypothetical protein PHYSODRAFT_322207 [Phytophthora sojae]EGZ28544.1 hypothetical protein PHYSODRAFT_322207 [Phytophthora sojae]|eukprot:XP_009515819.1 hypothetical protein PHYSODRAFT_322207 [Phytophthora sojae]
MRDSNAAQLEVMMCLGSPRLARPLAILLASKNEAYTASKRPGYFAYYEQPENVKNVLRTGEMQRLQEQIVHLQKQIDQLTEKIEKSAEGYEVGHTGITITSLKHWLATYGTPKPQSTSDLFTVFTPDKKVYGGTAHYSAFRTQASTMKKGRLTK